MWFIKSTLSIKYAAGLLKQFPGTTPLPKAPPFERGKQPGETFLRLVDCFQRLEDIAKHSGIPVLHFDRAAVNKAVNHFDFHPSDVYDMATLLVSDLAIFHARDKKPRYPSHDSIPRRPHFSFPCIPTSGGSICPTK